MREEVTPPLSQLIAELHAAPLSAPSSRRAFLARASALSLVVPGMGAALGACSRERNAAGDSSTSHVDAMHGPGTSAVGKGGESPPVVTATPELQSTSLHRIAPELPPIPVGNVQKIHWHAKAVPIRITDDTVVAAWTFEGDVPGPFVHTRVGDTVEFTLTNDVDMPHSMDFHAAQIDPKTAFRSVGKGESVTYTFKPKYAGAFLFHCGTAPVLMHIGSGMHGAIIVSPAQPLPPAKEFVLVESEFYLAAATAGVRAFDYQKMLSTLPDFVCFNGRPNQYIKDPIRVRLGDRVRFWVVNAGPTFHCSFHIVGEQFDTVYLGAPPGSPVHGVQTWDVPPGGGMCFELQCDVAGEFPFVNHGFGHGQKGSIGILVVEK
jgi:nitrite reductase (NO-forming)